MHGLCPQPVCAAAHALPHTWCLPPPPCTQVSDCLAEGAAAQTSVCYTEIELVEAGETKRYWIANHACAAPTTPSPVTTPNDPVCGASGALWRA